MVGTMVLDERDVGGDSVRELEHQPVLDSAHLEPRHLAEHLPCRVTDLETEQVVLGPRLLVLVMFGAIGGGRLVEHEARAPKALRAGAVRDLLEGEQPDPVVDAGRPDGQVPGHARTRRRLRLEDRSDRESPLRVVGVQLDGDLTHAARGACRSAPARCSSLNPVSTVGWMSERRATTQSSSVGGRATRRWQPSCGPGRERAHARAVRSHVRRTCINIGCVPTKALIESANHPSATGGPTARYADAIERKNALTALLRGKNYTMVDLHESATVITGRAHFVGKRELEVSAGDETISVRGDKVFIGTGSVPLLPPIPGLDGPRVVSSTELIDLTDLPPRLVVVGAGSIGPSSPPPTPRSGRR